MVLAVARSPAVALPPDLPGAAGGALASPNVHFVATIPDVGAVGARFIGDTLYLTTAQGLRIYALAEGLPVLQGALELPHFANEDVDTNGEILLVASDHSIGEANMLYVIDVSVPQIPSVLAVLPMPRRAHTATCIDDCRYAWVGSTTQGITIVDLRNPSLPTVAGFIEYSAHDVEMDENGVAWVVGADGIRAYSTADPVAPVRLVDGTGFTNRFILHNVLHPDAGALDPARLSDLRIDPGELIILTEENWISATNDLCAEDGTVQTGWFHSRQATLRLDVLDTFSVGRGQLPTAKPVAGTCSAHYFDEGADIVAASWYEQGVRFLDVSRPENILEIGYYMPAVSQSSMTKLHGDLVYVFDIARGIDVLRFTGVAGDAQARAPLLRPSNRFASPRADLGWACRVPTV